MLKKRLVDAMDTVTKISKRVKPLIEQGCHPQRVYAEVLNCIAETPTVDAVEVVHARWEFGEIDILGQSVHCPVCGWGADKVNKAIWLEYPGHKFCGCCGARMDGDGDG